MGKHTIRGRHVRGGAGVNDPGRVALQLHVLQSSNEAGYIPGAGGGVGAAGGRLERSEGGVGLRGRPEDALVAPNLGTRTSRGAKTSLAALSRRGDALSRGHTVAGPGIEAPGNAFVGAGAAGGVGEAAVGVWEGLLAALLGVRPPAALLLLLVTALLLPLVTTRRGGSSQEGGGGAHFLLVVQTQFFEKELVPGVGEGEGLLSGDGVGDSGVDLVEPAQQIEDEVGLRYGLPDIAQFVGLLLHANAVGVNGQVPLSHRVEFVIQEDGARSFVRLEHSADGRPKGARRLRVVGHGEVEDGVGDGAVHPSADAEVSLRPGLVGGARGGGGGEMVQQPEFPTRGLERRRPLGEVGGLQLKGHGDVELDVDGGEGADGRGRVSP